MCVRCLMQQVKEIFTHFFFSLFGLYNGDGVCLLCGTSWIFIFDCTLKVSKQHTFCFTANVMKFHEMYNQISLH